MKITGTGSATPEKAVSNADLSEVVETSDEWITSRTGICNRHLATDEDSLSAIAFQAGKNALQAANLAPEELDLIILATSTPDDLFGSAGRVQALLGANHAVAFDLTAACSGFIFGLVTASQFIRTGVYQNILLIGADVLSRWVDWSDRRTCVLFGDGAGAVVIQRDLDRDRLLGFELRSDGRQNDCLNVPFSGQPQTLLADVTISQGSYKPVDMNGREVYRFAVEKVPEVVEKAMYRADITADQIDWLLLHQANQRIMNAVAKRLKIPSEKIISNLSEYGNTSAASIPLALDEAVKAGKVKPGDIIATSGFGAGLSWGAAIFEF